MDQHVRTPVGCGVVRVATPDSSEDRKGIAARHLARLAVEVRRIGLTAVVDPYHQPFPGLLVASPLGREWIVVGSTDFWWEGDSLQIGPLSDPVEVARRVAYRLRGVQS